MGEGGESVRAKGVKSETRLASFSLTPLVLGQGGLHMGQRR